MFRDLADIENEALKEIEAIQDASGLEKIRIKYLGRRGIITDIMSRLPELAPEQRPRIGKQANDLKVKLIGFISERQRNLKTQTSAEKKQDLDLTLPGIRQEIGHKHPITQTIERICDIFVSIGFKIVEGPEIETEYNNFTALNIPIDHPSRDAFDTFYLETENQKLLLRSHTSPVQIRAMKKYKPPLAVVVPGKVYRPDAVDASHSFMFYQVEGFFVDEDVKFSDLKGILTHFAKKMFGQDIKMRFRPHFFPFTEPSAEVDISCIICKGKGCSACGRKGWLEILGAGMIHPAVFEHVGYDAKKFTPLEKSIKKIGKKENSLTGLTGFAFGMGVDRIAMLKYGINDIRLFYENDLRFLRQF
ncbi:MAG: phenylalanine--tRNA ligase subunit alpha [Candidatus Omnitrophica bacterium]|nr:phenylalanine--tRNA ligase subunit alpha [Candidatus Omnitrophota bacterium]